MQTVLIVDDEKKDRNVIKIMLETFYPDTFQIVEASSGNQALKIIEKCSPSLIFMDIKMPGINGIEAISQIREHTKDNYIIILTAFDYFEYAKEALKLGVNDFLLKPLIRDEFKKSMSAYLEYIEKLQNSFTIDKQSVHQLIKQNLVSTLAYNSSNTELTEFYFHMMNLQFHYGCCFAIQIDSPEVLANPKLYQFQMEQMESRLISKLEQKELNFIANMIGSNLIFFVLCDQRNPHPMNDVLRDIEQWMEDLQKSYSIQYGIGNGYTEKEQLNKSFDECIRKITQWDHQVKFNHEMVRMILKEVREEKTDQAEKLLIDLILQLDSAYTNLNLLKTIMLEILTTMTRNVLPHKLQEEFINQLSSLLSLTNLDDITTLCRGYIVKLIHCLKHDVVPVKNHVIDYVKNYVYKHYQEDINIKSLADKFSLNPFYFSKLFKDQENINFTDFVTAVRMEKAIELMKDEQKNIKAISMEVGYQDQNYFSRVFKKTIGLGPKEYRRKFTMERQILNEH